MFNFKLYFRVYLWRLLVRINSYLDTRWSSLPPPRAEKRVFADGPKGNTIPLLVYTPTGLLHDRSTTALHPLVINFHGGGFMMGTAEEDARWAEAVTELGAVMISVDYRLCPEHPYPAAIEDCVAAVEWVWNNHEYLKVDRQRTILSGFSAGGNLTFVVAMRIIQHSKTQGKIAGLFSVYPGIDRTISRATKKASNNKSVEMGSLNLLFDEAYGCHALDLSNHEISPGKASDKQLTCGLPQHIAIYTAEFDPLLAEAETFRKRLKELGKTMYGDVVSDRGHYWDKKPSYGRIDEVRTAWLKRSSEIVQSMWTT